MGVVYKAEDTRLGRNVALKHRLQGHSMQTGELLHLGIQNAAAFDAVHSKGIVLYNRFGSNEAICKKTVLANLRSNFVIAPRWSGHIIFLHHD